MKKKAVALLLALSLLVSALPGCAPAGEEPQP